MRRVAVLIDGGFLLKRLPRLVDREELRDPEKVARRIGWIVANHLQKINETEQVANKFSLLYRTFYYDARPYSERGHRPITRKALDYSCSEEFVFRSNLFDHLRRSPFLAVRLGDVRKETDRSWILRSTVQNDLLARKRTVEDLVDEDFVPALHQKGVDMRIGLDMAALALKGQVDTIVLVTGDSDFVPAAKLVRREGVRLVLDPLWQNVDPGLFEHIDSVYSGVPRKQKKSDTTDQSGEA